ncbi:unnamed protein product [Brugia timori]|uniref:Secreted protein n=1 Tax=Brugia timori TaxID=42155 RepID=A0A0R3QZL2_9BILA|nr:unnamed protein product [Brugia timori]
MNAYIFCMYECISACVCVQLYVCVHVFVCIYVCAYVCVCVYRCMYVGVLFFAFQSKLPYRKNVIFFLSSHRQLLSKQFLK